VLLGIVLIKTPYFISKNLSNIKTGKRLVGKLAQKQSPIKKELSKL
jgi:hypothetical protein